MLMLKIWIKLVVDVRNGYETSWNGIDQENLWAYRAATCGGIPVVTGGAIGSDQSELRIVK